MCEMSSSSPSVFVILFITETEHKPGGYTKLLGAMGFNFGGCNFGLWLDRFQGLILQVMAHPEPPFAHPPLPRSSGSSRGLGAFLCSVPCPLLQRRHPRVPQGLGNRDFLDNCVESTQSIQGEEGAESESSTQTHSIVSLSYVRWHFNYEGSKLRNLCQAPNLNFPWLL